MKKLFNNCVRCVGKRPAVTDKNKQILLRYEYYMKAISWFVDKALKAGFVKLAAKG